MIIRKSTKWINNFLKTSEENISQEFRSKNTDKTRNDFIEKIEQNEFMSKKYKKVSKTLNYIYYFLLLSSVVSECVSISAFA